MKTSPVEAPTQFPDDKFYVGFNDDSYQNYAVLHNKYLDKSCHNKYIYRLNDIQPKDNCRPSGFGTVLVGKFNSVFEAQLFAKKKRGEIVSGRIIAFEFNLSEQKSEVSTEYQRIRRALNSFRGEMKALNHWMTKKAQLHPEYFI